NVVGTDGQSLESWWHRMAMNLLIEVVTYHLHQRNDFYVGGNMFIYFSTVQARNRDFRGPDFFFVEGVNREPMRPYWAVWLEGGRYPDVIVEILSPRTATEDRTTKKNIYEQVFRTAEYYCYDPETQQLEGWQLHRSEEHTSELQSHLNLVCRLLLEKKKKTKTKKNKSQQKKQ